MEHRVYDTKRKKWVNKKTYLTSNGELYVVNQSVLGWSKLSELPQDRYICHKSVEGLQDKNGKQVFEGDIIKAQVDEAKEEIGLVAYVPYSSSHLMLCFNDTFYTLGSEVSKDIEIVDNVFDRKQEVVQNGEQTLSRPKE